MEEDMAKEEMHTHLVECARRVLKAVADSVDEDLPGDFDMPMVLESLGHTCPHDVIAAVMLLRNLSARMYPDVKSFEDDSAMLLAQIRLAKIA